MMAVLEEEEVVARNLQKNKHSMYRHREVPNIIDVRVHYKMRHLN